MTDKIDDIFSELSKVQSEKTETDGFYVDNKFKEVFMNSEYDASTFVGKFFHLWKFRFYIRNFKKKITLRDIPKIPTNDESEKQYIILEREWEKECKNAAEKRKNPSLLWPILRLHGPFLIWLSIFGFVAQFSVLYQAICMKDLINKTNKLTDLRTNLNGTSTEELQESIQTTKNQIYFRCFIMVLLQFCYANAINVYNFHTVLIGYRLKISISSMVYRKTLKLSKSGFANTSVGQIQTLLSGDMNRLESIFYLVAYPFIGMILSVVTICVLWPYLAWYVFVGMFVLFLIIPLQSYLGKVFSEIRLIAAYKTDERMKQMNEFIPAIRVIKMYCFENEFAKKISEARKNEVNKIKNCLYIFSVNMALFYTGAKVIIYATLVCFVLFSEFGKIDSELVYVTFATMNKLSFVCLLYLPHFFLSSINGLIAIERINNFLILDQVENTDLDVKEKLLNGKSSVSVRKLYSAYVAKANSTIGGNQAKSDNKTNSRDNQGFVMDEKLKETKIIALDEICVLKNINFECKPGELICVIGPVGSSKSSLLLSILGELYIKNGSIQVKGRYSYASQEAWTFAGTVKENILFGSKFDEKKYKEVVRVCALERDMILFPEGDQTIVGERGVALSGGQRARINLARALYYEADIYLLDDPLSAVDPHVAKHIFKEAIQEYLSEKIVILVTHQLQFVKNSTKVLLIKDGQQVAYGNFNDLNNDFSSFVGLADLNEPKEQIERIRRDSSRFGSTVSLQAAANTMANPKIYSRQDSADSIQQNRLFEDEDLFSEKIVGGEGEYRTREISTECNITNGKGAMTYIKAGIMNKWIAPIVILLFVSAQLSYSFADYFLKLWTSHAESQDSLKNTGLHSSVDELLSKEPLNFTDQLKNEVSNLTEFSGNLNESDFMSKFTTVQSIYIYSAIICCLIVFSLSRTLVFFNLCMEASKKIHDDLFNKIVRAPVSFFDKGSNQFQILNRMSKDLQIVDDVLPYRFFDFIDITITDISICIMILLIKPLLGVPILILGCLVLLIRKVYLRTARSIAMVEGMAKAPMVQHLTSSINGISTIKSMRSQKRFIRKFDMFQNDYSSALFTLICSRRWLVYVMDTIQCIFIGGILFVVCLLLPDGPTMGLIVSSVLQFTAEFQWLVINWTDFSTFLTSVERLNQYSSIDQEPQLESAPDKKPPSDWPKQGRIEFQNVSMKYFEDEDPVLKNLNFTIASFQKIGVVGRTGAGKSSLISALFRMTEYEGDIIIDGVNTKDIGLHELRKKIAIIPQEPVLFTGTVRSNLDPTDSKEHNDSELWDALRESQLEKTIKDMDGGLDAQIVDSGSNFSIGQKQLICLARAVLRRNKILVLDEATANCDPQTDQLIQNTIRTVFKDCTIITVAHRLNTIIDSDKILVMDSGEAKEFDTPYNLVRIPRSLFCSMVNATGAQNAKVLKISAKNSSFRKSSLQSLDS